MVESWLFSKHLEEDESVQMIVHQHWSVGAKAMALPLVGFALSFALLAISAEYGALMVVGVCALVSGVWLLRNFFDYYLDAWIITDHGIIDLEWHGWFHRHSARVLYSDIQGVSYEIQGVVSTVMRYGTLSVEKISTGTTIALPNVPQPRSVEACILQNMERYLHKKNLKNAKHVQEILASFVAQQVQIEEVSKKPVMVQEAIAPGSGRKRSFRSAKIGSKRKED